MILDKISQAARYADMRPGFKEAFEFLKNARAVECGRHELGNGVYANVMDVKTHETGKVPFEAHRQYIDIQYLLAGHSAFAWAHTPALETVTPYDEAKDAEFLEGKRAMIPVEAGDFYVLFPEDAHEPHCTLGEESAYRVVVVKVPV